MYIISYLNPKTGKIVSRQVQEITEKNILFVNKVSGYIDYLFEKAVEILSSNVSSRYKTHYKLKRNGKYRRIDEPDEDLKKYMRSVNDIFVNEFNFLFPDCVGAYVKNRSLKQVAQKHIGAYAIIKLDIEDFFENCTLKKVMTSLHMIYPFCLIDYAKLEAIIKACMIEYDGDYRLPQGAPSSPTLSNLTMIPIDFHFSHFHQCTYTRYADDMYFSYTTQANNLTLKSILKRVISQLSHYGFNLNQSKTQFLKTKNGNVWILGISVGKDISIGNKNKQHIKAHIWSFLQDTHDGIIWSRDDVQKLVGSVNYFKHIEPDFINSIIQKYEEKTSVSYEQSVKNILRS